MAVSNVIIICVLIGFLSELVSNHPIKRRSEISQYLLPRTLGENDAFDIKLIYTKFLMIRLITHEDKIAYTFTGNAEEPANSDRRFVLKTSFVEDSTVALNFTVRRSRKTNLINIISIQGPNGVMGTITMPDISIDDIKYLTITGKGEKDVRRLELKFTFS